MSHIAMGFRSHLMPLAGTGSPRRAYGTLIRSASLWQKQQSRTRSIVPSISSLNSPISRDSHSLVQLSDLCFATIPSISICSGSTHSYNELGLPQSEEPPPATSTKALKGQIKTRPRRPKTQIRGLCFSPPITYEFRIPNALKTRWQRCPTT